MTDRLVESFYVATTSQKHLKFPSPGVTKYFGARFIASFDLLCTINYCIDDLINFVALDKFFIAKEYALCW